MIALNDRTQVTSACKPWCVDHRPSANGDLSHLSEPITFVRSDGESVKLQLDTLETSDSIHGPRIYLTQDGQDDALAVDDARTLADALNELINATEVSA